MKVPSNIQGMGVPHMNQHIYLKVQANVKNKDSCRAVQENQQIFMSVVSALVQITDTLNEHEKDGQWIKDSTKLAVDAITVAASLQNDWMKTRTDDMKPSLPEDFKRLTSVEVPMTVKNLFGDDLESSIKTLESKNKRWSIKNQRSPINRKRTPTKMSTKRKGSSRTMITIHPATTTTTRVALKESQFQYLIT